MVSDTSSPPTEAPDRRARLPGIRVLLLATYLVVLLLPVAGVGILRLYESALIRQTEAELLAQAAVLSSAYRAAWLQQAGPDGARAMPRADLQWGGPQFGNAEDHWAPLVPQLDLAEGPILPRPADGVPAKQPPEAAARAIAPRLASVANDVRRMTLAAIRILDARGVVVAATSGDGIGLDMSAQEEVAEALRGAPKAVLRERLVVPADYSWGSISRNTSLRVFVAVPAIDDGHVLGVVLVSRTPRNIEQTLYNKRWALLEMALLLIVVVVALAFFAGHAVARPMRQLADMARRVARGEIRAVAPLSLPITSEARSLSDSIVTMAQTLEARAQYVRELAVGISHEFKTPLTGIRGGAELLRDHLEEMSVEERHRFLANIVTDTDRLDRLVRRLLELARADFLTPEGSEDCDLAEAIRQASWRAKNRGHRVVVDALPDRLMASIDRESFDIVLSNLVENALQHGGPGVTVRLNGAVLDGEAVIDVTDDGAGVSPGNADRIFDNFFTTARGDGGTGLGLAIARRRAMAFGGSLDLMPKAGGAWFRVRLKAA
ncbi:MAG: HAMP domain-containing histidine kinase [Alphaproteobacteria bacterium]|nr:HAMP domain-containing histidine kinase [Alphaproteobacteria bacterium]